MSANGTKRLRYGMNSVNGTDFGQRYGIHSHGIHPAPHQASDSAGVPCSSCLCINQKDPKSNNLKSIKINQNKLKYIPTYTYIYFLSYSFYLLYTYIYI